MARRPRPLADVAVACPAWLPAGRVRPGPAGQKHLDGLSILGRHPRYWPGVQLGKELTVFLSEAVTVLRLEQ